MVAPTSRAHLAGPAFWTLLIVAASFPTAAALLYFVALADHELAPLVYALTKAAQFALPLLALASLASQRIERQVSAKRALVSGLVVGAVMAIATIATYLALPPALLAAVGESVSAKVEAFGIASPRLYVAFALFLSLIHSGLEEYYWRWFLYRSLTRALRPLWAAVLSSLAFTAHHVVIVWAFVPVSERWWVLLASVAVLTAGLAWAHQYQRTGRLVAPWLSHVCADLAVLGIGWRLLS